MSSIAIYFLFISSLAGYRCSRYWPNTVAGISWLKNGWYHFGGLTAGTLLLISNKGYTVGVLTALCVYMTLASAVIFVVNCKKTIRVITLVAFNIAVLLNFFLN